jgi:F-type H+-transporting ATPase subunit b
MNPLIDTFHIDIVMLVAQVVNFAIVFFVLYIFAVKPLMKVLDRRAEEARQGAEDAQKAAVSLAEANNERTAILAEARNEAHTLLLRIEEESEKKRVAALAELRTELERERAKDKQRAETEAERFRDELKTEAVDIVVHALERILATGTLSATDTAIVNRALASDASDHPTSV